MEIPKAFEQGPIRPPSEAGSLLLRFTRNCPWNKCTFCPLYKKETFTRRSLEEIKRDIDAVRNIIEELRALSWALGYGGKITHHILNEIFTKPEYSNCHRHVAAWLFHSHGTVFIQDANSLILSTRTLVEALQYLRTRIGGITRITSYARSNTLARKSLAELKEIREAGLDRIHIGLESGSDRVLKFVRKGVTARIHIIAGQKTMEAGMTLSEYIMPGLGGREFSREHAIQTADVLNHINPHFIRLRSLRIPPSAPLYQDMVEGLFTPLHDDEVVKEIRLLIESLDGITSTLTSDHIMNLLEEVSGTFPQDKDKMLAVIDNYLALSEEEKLLFRLGRRGGALRSVHELNNASLKAKLEDVKHQLESECDGDLEKVIAQLGDQYI